MNNIIKNPHILLLIYVLIISLSFHVGHAITNDIHPVVLTFFRFALGAVIFSTFIFRQYDVKKPSVKDISRYTLISLTLVGYFLAMFYALRFTSAVNASLIFVTVPIFTTIGGMVLLRQYPPFYKVIILLLTMLGSVWVIADGDVSNLISLKLNIGDIIFLFGCMSIGLYPVLTKLFARQEPTAVLTFWTLFTGAVVLGFFANTRIFEMDWLNAPARLYWGLAFIVILSTVVTFFIVQYASRKIPVSKVTAYVYLIPVYVMLEDMLITGVYPPVAVWPGVTLLSWGRSFL